MKYDANEFIWEEKYRPQTVEDCVLPQSIRIKADKIIKDVEMQNMLFYSGPGTGKALANGCSIITPEGAVNIEDLKFGDMVCGTKGFINVLGVYPQGERDIYKVSFSDGTSLDVDGEHLWSVNYRERGQRTMTTLDMMSKYLQGAENKKVFSLPSYESVPYTEKDLNINPFLLGVWLGDGSYDGGLITLPKNKIDPTRFNMEYKYFNGRGENCGHYYVYGLVTKLREIKLYKNKHIPEEYFYGSIQQRQDLLDGLLETDGHDTGMSGWDFSNTNENIVDGVVRLARSLGYIAKRTKTKDKPFYRDKDGNKVICKPCYRCRIKHPSARTAKRYVSNIEFIKKDLATCIMVDAEDHLFLAGDFIPTHNTTLAKAICKQLGLDYILINGSREGRLIETVRNTVTHFANTMSVLGGRGMKVVIYDEFDNAGDVQMAIRGLMDEVSAGCRFIFTGNYVTKIIEPIQSRTTMVDFSIPIKEQPVIMGNIMSRCMEILDHEKVPYDKKVLAKFITKAFPDFRKILNELQAYSAMGQIDAGILELLTTRYSSLVDSIMIKDFKGCEKWMTGNTYDGSIYSLLLKGLRGKSGKGYADVVLCADDAQYRHAFAVDPDICLKAFCLNVMSVI